MVQNEFEPLPYPFTVTATHQGLADSREYAAVIDRLLEDATGHAGAIASALTDEEADQDAMLYASRALAEHLRATLALWREWQAREQAA